MNVKIIFSIIVLSVFFVGCRNTEEKEFFSNADSTSIVSKIDFVGEYYNPRQNQTNEQGERIKLLIRKDSIDNRYLISFSTDASRGNDSCALEARAIKRNDTLFTYITTGVDSALMYITILPQNQRKTLDVFTTRFKDINLLKNFCIGNGSLIGNYELSELPVSLLDSTQRKLGFIRSFVDKKATEVQLFQFAVVRERLSMLLGAEEFNTLIKNWTVEQPLEQKQDEIYKVSACKTTRCNVYKTNIFFDIPNDNITVVITKKGEAIINTEKPSLQLPPALLQEIKKE